MPDQSPAVGETIGQRLKRLRLDRHMSQRELAAPGVSYAYISRIEAGTRQPSVKALRRLASKLGVSADYLETGSDLDAASARELRLADLELAVRLGEFDGTESPLHEALAESISVGDRQLAVRARVALASIALERGEFASTISLLQAAIEGEPFSPIDRFEIYANLGRAFAASGQAKEAAELFERCIDGVMEAGGDASLEARYATLLSYALSDMGEIERAEQVVRTALDRVDETADPYMRVRLYWSIARLAHTKGRESAALENVRKAIALLQATDDTFHLARAHILAAEITLARSDVNAAENHLGQAERLLASGAASQDLFEIKLHRSRIALQKGEASAAIAYAREALVLGRAAQPADEGLATFAFADAQALAGDFAAATECYERAAKLLEGAGRWHAASSACRMWGRMLRENGHEEQALDVLDRAAELGTRAAPEGARAGH
jgi:transcriptional regulator with XRE-family HTH domain